MTALPVAGMAHSVRSGWRDLDAPQRTAVLVGGALMLVGAAHLLGYVLASGSWYGPLGWRKPFAFGLSFGITTLTLGIATGALLRSLRAHWAVCGALVAANTVEVAWVSIQRARGVPSHFNFDTTFDAAFFIANGVAIAVTVTAIVVLAVQSFRVRALDPAMRLAWQVGLLVLLVSMGVGGVMISHGIAAAEAGAANLTTVAPAGQLKVPHAVGMHAVQVLPLLAWSLRFTSAAARERLRVVGLAAGGYALLTAVSVVQAAAGRALTDPGPLLAALAAGGLLAVAAGYLVALLRLLRPRPALAARTTTI